MKTVLDPRASASFRRLATHATFCVAMGWVCVACQGLPGYWNDGSESEESSETDDGGLLNCRVEVIDEDGSPIEDATVEIAEYEEFTDASGFTELTELEGPVMAIVSTAGHVSEALAVDRSEPDVLVTLFANEGDDGVRRWIMHVDGDSMFARRFEELNDGEPLLPADDIAGGAEHVVANMTRPFSAADLRAVNLETVVSNLPVSDKYPAKIYTFISPPASLAALEALGVDLVTLGNNHIRDFMDAGVFDTRNHLDARGIKHVGSSANSRKFRELRALWG